MVACPRVGRRKLEMFAIWGFSTICVAMGQWNVAIRYCERMAALAEEVGLPQYALMGRTNIADCAIQLRDPAAGLRVLSSFELPESQNWDDARLLSALHINLGRLYLLVGDVAAATFHSEEATRWSAKYGSPDGIQLAEALHGLVSIRLREVAGRTHDVGKPACRAHDHESRTTYRRRDASASFARR